MKRRGFIATALGTVLFPWKKAAAAPREVVHDWTRMETYVTKHDNLPYFFMNGWRYKEQHDIPGYCIVERLRLAIDDQ
jgi:hypothetical protein